MNKIDLYPGQRKTSRATATISKGNGKVRINNIPAEVMEPEVAREVVLVPIHLIGEIRNRIDLSVKVHGGGFMGLEKEKEERTLKIILCPKAYAKR